MIELLPTRIQAKIRQEDGCWIWAGATSRGYGQVWSEGRVRPAHVVVFEILVGPIPDGRQLDHLCRVRRCVRSTHLEPVTNRVNTLRGDTITAANSVKTECANGHPYDEANTYRYADGRRWCRRCNADMAARARARRRAA